MNNRRRWIAGCAAIVGAWAAGCVGGGGGSEPADAGVDGTVSDGSVCFECQIGCFDCGSGCFCGFDGGTWRPPFPDAGHDGMWRNSDAPLCLNPGSRIDAVGLWGDTGGVYVAVTGGVLTPLVEEQAPTPQEPEVPVAGASGDMAGAGGFGGGAAGSGGTGGGVGVENGQRILFNDGEGWSVLAEQRTDAFGSSLGLMATGTGTFFTFGEAHRSDGTAACMLTRYDGEWTCERATGGQPDMAQTNAGNVLAALGRTLVAYDEATQTWSTVGPEAPEYLMSLAAREDYVLASDATGGVWTLRDQTWERLVNDGVPQLVSDGNRGPTWIVGADARVHRYDGQTLTELEQPGTGECDPTTTGAWSDGDTLYVHGWRWLLRWDGTRWDTLVDWSCDFSANAQIERIWGNGPDELFIVLRDFNLPFHGGCGEVAVMYFDGDSFHRL